MYIYLHNEAKGEICVILKPTQFHPEVYFLGSPRAKFWKLGGLRSSLTYIITSCKPFITRQCGPVTSTRS